MLKNRGVPGKNSGKGKVSSPSPRLRAMLDQLIGLVQSGRAQDGVEIAGMAVAMAKSNPEARHLQGICLMQAGNMTGAIAAFKKADALAPNQPALLNHGGVALCQAGRNEEGLAWLKKAVTLAPGFAEARNNYARALNEAGDFAGAAAQYRLVVTALPALVPAWLGLMAARHSLGDLAGAISVAQEAVGKVPDHSVLIANLGLLHIETMQTQEAETSLRRALELNPANGEAATNLGTILEERGQHEDAVAIYRLATRHHPDLADAWLNLGISLDKTGRLEEAAEALGQAVRLMPQHAGALGALVSVRRKLCDWTGLDVEIARLTALVEAPDYGKRLQAAPCFGFLSLPVSAALQQKAAIAHSGGIERQAARILPSTGPFVAAEPVKGWRKIRIGYLSPDFREHPIGQLMAGVIDDHDRSRFEISCWSIGPVAESRFRQRIVESCDRFEEISTLPVAECVSLMRAADLDIIVDLAGYTAHARPEILALRAAPIQVNYLGYPGSMGAQFIDYIIADPIILPASDEAFYTERVIRLPNCYQANDNRAIVAGTVFSRADFGLPEDAFVFCCFSMNYKIDPVVLDAWAKILAQVPDAVFWLYRTDMPASVNIHREFLSRGIAAGRIIFADRLDKANHLARHRLADLFVDTFAYGAHTTASDALWTGLPVLTLRGDTFARRVGASIVSAVGMSELVAETQDDYVRMAVDIGLGRLSSAALKQKLAQLLPVCALFDTDNFTRDLEAAYLTMQAERQMLLPTDPA